MAPMDTATLAYESNVTEFAAWQSPKLKQPTKRMNPDRNIQQMLSKV